MVVICNCRGVIEEKDVTIRMLLRKLEDVTADRNEWRSQHENLLAMYRGEVSKRFPVPTPS